MYICSKTYPNPDSSDFHIPPGEYLCKINNIATGFTTRNEGEECWKVEGEVAEGEYTGKKWQDRWIFNSQNPNTQKRQVLIQHRVGGFAKVFEGNIAPEDFVGKQVYVTFADNLYNGKCYHKVVFNGYRMAEEKKEQTEEQDISDDIIPF